MPQTPQQAINALSKFTKFRYMAMDENGDWCAYVKKPIEPGVGDSIWTWQDGDNPIVISRKFTDIHLTANWRDSLVECREK